MKKVLFLFFLSFAFIIQFSCKKEDNGCKIISPQEEETAILNYAAANGITAQKDPSGLYYQVLSQGSGATPTLSSMVSITYTGKLTNNTVFDQQMDASKTNWPLNSLIRGWQIGLPLIKKGGSIILIVPSSLAYGCQPIGAIPANSILVFNINLADVQ